MVPLRGTVMPPGSILTVSAFLVFQVRVEGKPLWIDVGSALIETDGGGAPAGDCTLVLMKQVTARMKVKNNLINRFIKEFPATIHY
jgi:hypothetical protein